MNSAPRVNGRRSPLEAYRTLLAEGAIREDSGQVPVVEELDRLWHQLEDAPEGGVLARIRRKRRASARGIYLWGSVGRGKTWLMDLLLETLSHQHCRRAHFHRFMARVHDELSRRASARNPLALIARDWAADCDVLCFDEFFVEDIADAMLLGGLLEALFREGVVLVATSNVHPDELYRGGLQRPRFLPAIECIKRHCAVVELAGDIDHRLRILESAGVFQSSLEPGCERAMERRFDQFSSGEDLGPDFTVNGRPFRSRRRSLGVVWFDFEELCRNARSALDYVELARDFNTLLLSRVPALDDASADAARRFISLVDALYDRNVKLVLSAAAEPGRLYTGERLSFEYQRTASRLIEMQSHDYLARPHLP